MKLLSPADAQAKAKKTLDSEKHRLVEVQTLVTQKYKELGQIESDFADALKKQRNVWAAVEQEHENKKLGLIKEVEDLEERKRQALIPLTETAKMLDTKASALDAFNLELDEREDALREEGQLFTQRLDEVAERELQADKTAKNLALREDGVKAQAAQIATSSALLTGAIAQAAQDASAKERANTLKEAELRAKEGNLQERERKVNEKESGFDNRERAIKDQYEALRQAIEETNKKYGTKQTIQRDTL